MPTSSGARPPARARAASIDNARNLGAKARRREAQRVVAAGGAIDPAGGRLEATHGGDDRLRRLRIEERAGRRGIVLAAHGLARAAPPVRDHRRAAGLRLDRRDAEVLLGREHERARVATRRAVSARPARPANSTFGTARLEPGALRTVADDDQPALGQRAEGLDQEVDPLVRNEARDGDVFAARLVRRRRAAVTKRSTSTGG